MPRVVHVVTNVSKYDNAEGTPTGLWLTELSHAWDVFAAHGYQQELVSPSGGRVPLEPKSLTDDTLDASGKTWLEDSAKKALFEHAPSPSELKDSEGIDAIYYTGGHAVMFDFLDSRPLQELARDIYERGGVVSSVCHGYCGLPNITLKDGSRLIEGKKLTGFSWKEEELAQVDKHVPYNAEELVKEKGAKYEAAEKPFTPYVVVDGRLVTGQNPMSAKETAEAVVKVLEARE